MLKGKHGRDGSTSLTTALGADFGGNLTLIGASANVVVAGMSERAGQRISFVKFMLYGIPVTLVSLVVATVYVLVRYY